jgi:hypothetical protein
MDLEHCLHTGYTWSPLTLYWLHWLYLEPTHLILATLDLDESRTLSALATLGAHSPSRLRAELAVERPKSVGRTGETEDGCSHRREDRVQEFG